MKYILQRMVITVSTFCTRFQNQHIFVHTVSQHSYVASYFARDGLFYMTCGKHMTVSDKSFVFTATVCAYSVPQFSFTRVVCQRLCGSHKPSKLLILHVLFGVDVESPLKFSVGIL